MDEYTEKRAAEPAAAEGAEERSWPFTGKKAVYLDETYGEEKAAEPLPDWLTGEADRAQVSQRLSEATASASREQLLRPKREQPLDTGPAEAAGQYGDLRMATYSAEPVSQPIPAGPSFIRRALRAARNLVLISLAIGLVAAIIWLVRPYLFGGAPSSPGEQPTPGGIVLPTSTAPAPAALPTAIPETSPSPPATMPTLPGASPTVPQEACLTWDQVKMEDEGKEVCVTGTIKRRFATSALPLVIVFSEAEGSFMLIDRVQTYSEAVQGACVRARGVVEIMSGVRPVLDSHGELTFCGP